MSYEKISATMKLIPKTMSYWKLADSNWTACLFFHELTTGTFSFTLQIRRDQHCFSRKRKSYIMLRMKKSTQDQTINSDASNYTIIEKQKSFDSDTLYFQDILERSEMFEENGEYSVEITLMLEKLENRMGKVPQFDFKDMNGSPKSDVIMNINGVKLYANKSYLAIHSEVFDRMFFSEFVERNQSEIILHDDDPEDFIELLKIIYPSAGSTIINPTNVQGIFKLADKYCMTHVMFQCEHFMKTIQDHSARAWLVAEKYDVPELMKRSKPTFVKQTGSNI